MMPRLQPVPLPPEDAADRARALDPAASFIVQAPAGSGKTTLLVQRFLVLLSRVAEPESIVAITFTRKAAAEMRARIVAALAPDGDAAPSPAAEAALRWDRERGWDLRRNPSRLRIQTIDSLCASIVQRMPMLARTGGMPGIAEDAWELYREAATHLLRHVAGDDAKAAEAVTRLLLHLDNDFRVLRAMFEGLLARRDQWLRHLGVNQDGVALRAALERALASVVGEGVSRAARHVPPLLLARLMDLYDGAALRCDPPRAVMNRADELSVWRALTGFLLSDKGEWRRSADARHGFPPNYKFEKQEYLGLLATLSSDGELREALAEVGKLPDPRFAGDQWEILEALIDLLPLAAAELKVTFRERGLMDFVELGETARRALGSAEHPTDLALTLGERVQHLLIDEFQDTSVSQFELIERLVATWGHGQEEHSLFLVGDPMQSIYRFREAQVGLFLRARTEGVGDVACEPLRLRANFRSRPGVVDWVNAAFAQIFPAVENPALGAVTYASSSASRAPVSSPAVVVHPFGSAAEDVEASAVARIVREALALGSTAVLLRARSHGRAIVAELARHRIPYRAVDFDALPERPAIQDLMALTRALLHPGDRAAWLAVLRAPWCGLTLEDLHELAASEPRAILYEQIANSGHPRLQLLAPALAAPVRLARRVPLRVAVEQAWRALGGPQCLANSAEAVDCERYLELLGQLGAAGDVDFGLLERRTAVLFAQPQTGDEAAVDVMTIHKAKGLEWDSVILPGLGREAASDSSPLLRWNEVPMPGGGSSLVFAPIEATGEEADPVFRYLAHVDRQCARHETARLLYVAATRARERLHLLGHAERNAHGGIRARSGTLLHLLWPVIGEEFSGLAGAAAPAPDAPLPQTLRRVPDGWVPAMRGAAVEWAAQEAEETEAVTFEWAGDLLRHAGTVTHRWLERIAREGPDAWTSARFEAQRRIWEDELAALGLDENDAARGAVLVAEALARTLADPRGRWLLGPHPEHATELRVSVVVDGVVHHGSIDRTFVDEAGVRWVVDYKTGRHEGAGLEAFLDNEVERYRTKLERYACYFRAVDPHPVRLALYFPLAGGGWREWTPA